MLVLPSSDASSEYFSTVDLTDSEDAGRNRSIVGESIAGQDLTGGSYAGLSPMIIMNNFVLKQVKYNNVCRPLPSTVYLISLAFLTLNSCFTLLSLKFLSFSSEI